VTEINARDLSLLRLDRLIAPMKMRKGTGSNVGGVGSFNGTGRLTGNAE